MSELHDYVQKRRIPLYTIRNIALGFSLAFSLTACGGQTTASTPTPSSAPEEKTGPRIAISHSDLIATYPHDTNSFTQGLEMHDGALYESRGLVGHSAVTKINPTDGSDVLQTVELPPSEFGEGLTFAKDDLYMLTWQSGTVHRYSADTLSPTTPLTIEGQGWGICYNTNDNTLVTSNGSSTLTIRDTDMKPLRTVDVSRDGIAIEHVNELECVGDYIYANIWLTNEIVVIEGASGKIVRTFDLTEVVPELTDLPIHISKQDAVLNGIAQVEDGSFIVTGKGWPVMYNVELPLP